MTARPPLVAVFLGTDHHRFDRLVRWSAQLHDEGRFRFHVQHGVTPLPPGLPGQPMLGSDGIARLLDAAVAVVTHGGPGTIMDARDRGHVPVVVPRDPRLDEHVDDHQLRFARFLGGRGVVTTAADLPQLRSRLHLAALTEHIPPQDRPVSPVTARFEAMVEELVRR